MPNNSSRGRFLRVVGGVTALAGLVEILTACGGGREPKPTQPAPQLNDTYNQGLKTVIYIGGREDPSGEFSDHVFLEVRHNAEIEDLYGEPRKTTRTTIRPVVVRYECDQHRVSRNPDAYTETEAVMLSADHIPLTERVNIPYREGRQLDEWFEDLGIEMDVFYKQQGVSLAEIVEGLANVQYTVRTGTVVTVMPVDVKGTGASNMDQLMSYNDTTMKYFPVGCE